MSIREYILFRKAIITGQLYAGHASKDGLRFSAQLIARSDILGYAALNIRTDISEFQPRLVII